MGNSDGLSDLSEAEVLARLTIEEKRALAEAALLEFPHLSHAALDEWLAEHGLTDAPPGLTTQEKVDLLLDRCEERVRTGTDPEALDRFLYGSVYPAALRAAGIDPANIAGREAAGE